MSYGLDASILAVLRSDPELAVPLSRLHSALTETSGPALAPLRERLRERSDLFVLLEPAPLPWDGAGWSERDRQGYRAAFRAAGLEPEPRVVPRQLGLELPPSDELDDLMQRLSSTLIDLWELTLDEPELRAEITSALDALPFIRAELDREAGSPSALDPSE